VLSINDEFDNIGSLSVYPNPTNSSAQISFNLKENVQNLSIKVRNAVGQIVTNVVEGQSFSVGKYTLKVDEQRRLSSGVYFIEFNADDNVKVKKLIVQ
ncbi:MAG: T9SS type A sorting domain-containing protein, partial [Flavobacteriales bacterium]|nr:T9SS type A sorting domain-containing protein [Flavobacteriales bacterium]